MTRSYMDAFQPVISELPWLPVIGNHEYCEQSHLVQEGWHFSCERETIMQRQVHFQSSD